MATHPRGRVWHRWHLLPAGGATAVKQRVQISLLVLLALILAVLLTGMVATFNLYRSAEDHYIGQVLPLSTTARDVLFQMQREETGARGFLITSNRLSLAPYKQGRVICVSPHPEQTEGLKDLVPSAIRWALAHPTEE